MISLTTQKDFRNVQGLPFCYLCGRSFLLGEPTDRDHLPPENIFLKEDREPLWLPTHTPCNHSNHEIDEKIGQLIALRYGKVPTTPKNRKLRFTVSPDMRHGAVNNLNIDEAVWRWVSGFHAALYREPLQYRQHASGSLERSLVTPFPRGRTENGKVIIDPLLPQHAAFVCQIKLNRAKGNVDRISTNKRRFIYECVWEQADGGGAWMCFFALNIYDWKDLGKVEGLPARGCAGYYVLSSGDLPAVATKGVRSPIVVPNLDPLDPFGA